MPNGFIVYRTYLAVLHFGENSDRMQAMRQDGELHYSVRFFKYKKGDYTVTPKKTKPTYDDILRYLPKLYSIHLYSRRNCVPFVLEVQHSCEHVKVH